jgi:hypothetical protein
MNGVTALTLEFGLNEDELKEAAEMISRAKPGTYTARRLYGSAWIAKSDPHGFGTRLKASVNARKLPGITFLRTDTANAARYLLHGG